MYSHRTNPPAALAPRARDACTTPIVSDVKRIWRAQIVYTSRWQHTYRCYVCERYTIFYIDIFYMCPCVYENILYWQFTPFRSRCVMTSAPGFAKRHRSGKDTPIVYMYTQLSPDYQVKIKPAQAFVTSAPIRVDAVVESIEHPATHTHTDLIHACVNPCVYDVRSPRNLLRARVHSQWKCACVFVRAMKSG